MEPCRGGDLLEPTAWAVCAGGLDVPLLFVDVSPSCQQVAGSKDDYLSIKLQIGLSENSRPSIETIYV